MAEAPFGLFLCGGPGPVVQHAVNNDARHRHEHPDGKCDSGERLVSIPAFGERMPEDKHSENRDGRGEDNMRPEYELVGGSRNSVTGEPFAVLTRVLPKRVVIGQIACEKHDRGCEGRDHEISMQRAFLLADCDETGDEKNGRQ